MSELGQFLKTTRQEKEISLNEIQARTKIRKRYLEAIENGEYSVLPGQFYARAFIKSYAEALGLDSEEVLSEYADELPQVPTSSVETVVPKRKKEINVPSTKVGKWASRLVLYLFLLLVGVVIYTALVTYLEARDEPLIDSEQPGVSVEEGDPSSTNAHLPDEDVERDNNETGSESEPEEADEPNQVEDVDSNEPELILSESNGDTTTFEYHHAEHVQITVEANDGNVWYRLTNLDSDRQDTIDEQTLTMGNEQSWDMSEYEQVRFRFGNTDVITLSINDEPIDLSDVPQTHNLIFHFNP